jgi:hypothetical protein
MDLQLGYADLSVMMRFITCNFRKKLMFQSSSGRVVLIKTTNPKEEFQC